MTTAQPRPLQFSLKHIFGLMNLVGILLLLVPAAARTGCPLAPYYVVYGVVQLAFAATVYRRWRAHDPSRVYKQERSCELALLGAEITLGTWVFTLIFAVSILIGVPNWCGGLFLWVIMASLTLHAPILCVQVVALFTMRGGPGHVPLTTLFLLNIVNTLIVLAMLGFAISMGLLPERL